MLPGIKVVTSKKPGAKIMNFHCACQSVEFSITLDEEGNFQFECIHCHKAWDEVDLIAFNSSDRSIHDTSSSK